MKKGSSAGFYNVFQSLELFGATYWIFNLLDFLARLVGPEWIIFAVAKRNLQEPLFVFGCEQGVDDPLELVLIFGCDEIDCLAGGQRGQHHQKFSKQHDWPKITHEYSILALFYTPNKPRLLTFLLRPLTW